MRMYNIFSGRQTQRQNKTSGWTFRPPIPNPLLQGGVKFFLPAIFRLMLKGFSVQIDAESLARLKATRGQRCLLLPNHPAQWDPWAMFELSRRIDENFFFVAAREVFDWHGGLQGWIMQRAGCYSVVRGASDKDSFKTTKEILMENKGRLVIFVEGEISNQNDSLLPLEPGVIHLAFLSLQELYRQRGKDLEQLPSLYVCPVAIKYFYKTRGLNSTIDAALTRLEAATGLRAEGKSFYDRLRTLGRKVLEETSWQIGYSLDGNGSLDEQIRGLENAMLIKLEQVVNLPEDNTLSYLDRVRRIRNMVDRVIKDHPEDETYYHKHLRDHQKAVLENFYWDLERIVNFIAIYDGYIQPDMVAERYVEVIRRLEKEVFGQYLLRHPRTAVLKVLEPIDLKRWFEVYLADKKRTVEELTQTIEQELYQGIVTAQLKPQLQPVG